MDIEQRTRKTIAELLGLDLRFVTDDKGLTADLDTDSLDDIEIVMALEDEFNIEIEDEVAEKCVTVGDVIALMQQLAAAKA